MTFTEEQHVFIAQQEYEESLTIGKPIIIDETQNLILGTVTKIYDDRQSGLRAIVVKEPNDDLIVLYEGSEQPFKEGSFADWVKTDIPMAAQILTKPDDNTSPGMLLRPMQLELAAMVLRSVMRDNPNSQISVYGHSLGSMNAQYALANIDKGQEDCVKGAWIYNGPNIYHVKSSYNQRQQYQWT